MTRCFLGPKESKLFYSSGIPSRWARGRKNRILVNQCVAEGDLYQENVLDTDCTDDTVFLRAERIKEL